MEKRRAFKREHSVYYFSKTADNVAFYLIWSDAGSVKSMLNYMKTLQPTQGTPVILWIFGDEMDQVSVTDSLASLTFPVLTRHIKNPAHELLAHDINLYAELLRDSNKLSSLLDMKELFMGRYQVRLGRPLTNRDLLNQQLGQLTFNNCRIAGSMFAPPGTQPFSVIAHPLLKMEKLSGASYEEMGRDLSIAAKHTILTQNKLLPITTSQPGDYLSIVMVEQGDLELLVPWIEAELTRPLKPALIYVGILNEAIDWKPAHFNVFRRLHQYPTVEYELHPGAKPGELISAALERLTLIYKCMVMNAKFSMDTRQATMIGRYIQAATKHDVDEQNIDAEISKLMNNIKNWKVQ